MRNRSMSKQIEKAERGAVFNGVGTSNQLVYLTTGVDGLPSNNVSYEFSFSPDGQKVLFTSYASNLVSNDTNSYIDVFMKDLVSGEIKIVSSYANGSQFGEGSMGVFHPDGNRIAFVGAGSIQLKNLTTGDVEAITSESGGSCFGPKFSADGKLLAFMSLANIGGSQNSEGGGNGSGGNGGQSGSSDFLVTELFIKNLENGELTRIPLFDQDGAMPGSYGSLKFSPDGSMLVLATAADGLVANDSNGTFDIFTFDIASQVFTLVSKAMDDSAANDSSFTPTFSPDGSKIVYSTSATNILDGQKPYVQNIVEYDLLTQQTRFLVMVDGQGLSTGSASSFEYSSDGTNGLFISNSSDFFPDGNGGAVLQNLATGAFQTIAHELVANQPNGGNYSATFSPDGTAIAIESSGKFDENGNIIHKPGVYYYSLQPQPASGEDHVGGKAIDTATYATAASGLTIDLRDADGSSNLGDALNDTFVSIEKFILTEHDDVFIGLDRHTGVERVEGGRGNDLLFGGNGRDHLNGGVGDDWLSGGKGMDRLTGGEGADTFVFAHSERGKDTITDYEWGIDTLRLEGVLASQVKIKLVGDDAVVSVKGQGAVVVVDGVSDTAALWDDLVFA